MARTKTHEIRELHPRDADTKYFGPEPFFKQDEPNKWSLGSALTWYGHFYDKKDAREFIAQYLESKDKSEKAKLIRRVSDNKVIASYGYLARCFMRGYAYEEHTTRLDDEIDRMIRTISTGQPVDKPIINRPNVQEIMREKTNEAGGELEGLWDEYIQDGCKKENAINTISVLSQYNILPQHIHILIDDWNKKLNEYSELQAGKDEQLNEAYARFGKIQIRNCISTIESVITELNSYINIKKTGRKPRAKKPISVEKIVRSLKYLKTFKLEKLELVSVPPTKLHGCAEAWVYDTKKRKLHHYIGDEYTKTLSVKGNTVIGFCTKQSEIKTLRKPEVQIKEIMGSKPAARKYFKDIKAVSVSPNGRFNADMIILKAF